MTIGLMIVLIVLVFIAGFLAGHWNAMRERPLDWSLLDGIDDGR